MRDVLPRESAIWRRLHATAEAVFAAYGYGEIRLPLIERTELFKRAVGEVTDVVEKEMYSFEDRGGESISLRPEGTAGCVRAGIEAGLLHNQQQRLWYAGPMFRYERPQAGRYRQFHQIGCETYGIAGPDIDVEVIALSARLWRRLGLRDLRLEINSLGTPQTRARYREELVTFLRHHEDALDADARKRLDSNPLRILDSKVPATRALLADAPSILGTLDEAGRAHWDGLRRGLDALRIDYVENPRLVRGLDYYTHGVFEWVTDTLGAQGTICAGGRYDHLVEQLGGGSVPAVGWAAGVERLALLLAEQAPADLDAPHAVLCWLGEAAQRVALTEAERLRDALPSLRLLLQAGGGSLKAQLRRADASGASHALILGEAEVERGVVQVKSLRDGAAPVEVPIPELAGTLSSLVADA
jgi:histidyl-tRNA synthetase (EC 6.1.1.21)